MGWLLRIWLGECATFWYNTYLLYNDRVLLTNQTKLMLTTSLHRRMILLFVSAAFVISAHAKTPSTIIFNKGYDSIRITKADSLVLQLNCRRGGTYQVLTQQLGIDVMLVLYNNKGVKLMDMDSPNGSHGFEVLEFTATAGEPYTLVIKKFEQPNSSEKGWISYYVKQFAAKELQLREQSKKELAIENQRNVLTADIDHFWEAFDNLQHCNTYWDSILSFQNLYFDRATDGLIDFIKARDFTIEKFVQAVARYPKFYTTVRSYTYESKKAAPLIEEVFNKVKGMYSNFKPFKVCFAIGFRYTGGTVSKRFVLLGTELVTAGKNVDFSEVDPDWKPNPDKKEADIPLSIRGIVAHECVHTQQPDALDSDAVACELLNHCLREGGANFIGELITGTTNYSAVNKYGDAHEAALWIAFRNELCNVSAANWLYNGETAKDKPADLGYYIGYKICQAYYNNAADKTQAIRDIIEIKDPLSFLKKSGYDKQKKQ